MIAPGAKRSFVLVITLALSGCRCDDGRRTEADVGAQPTMPTGMLTPNVSSSAASTARGALLLRASHFRKNETVVIKIDGDDLDASFTFADAIAVLHEPLAQTLPGFNLLVPKLFPPTTLSLLQSQLGAFRLAWTATTTAVEAKERWGKLSSVIAELASDAEWREAQAALLTTIDAIFATAKKAESQGKGLWIRTAS